MTERDAVAVLREGLPTIHFPLSDEQEIALDQLAYLRENPDTCAQVSVHVGRHPWVRWNGEQYEIAEVSGVGNLEVEPCIADDLLNLFAENPVHVKPRAKATFSPPEPGAANIWDRVEADSEEVKRVA